MIPYLCLFFVAIIAGNLADFFRFRKILSTVAGKDVTEYDVM